MDNAALLAKQSGIVVYLPCIVMRNAWRFLRVNIPETKGVHKLYLKQNYNHSNYLYVNEIVLSEEEWADPKAVTPVSDSEIIDTYSDTWVAVDDFGRKVADFEEVGPVKEGLREVFKKESIDAVINFAGLKAVGESVAKPIEYYDNNLISTIALLEVMNEFGVKKIVFSSSATVYGMNNVSPYTEDMPTSATNPYGQTKSMLEEVLNVMSRRLMSVCMSIISSCACCVIASSFSLMAFTACIRFS